MKANQLFGHTRDVVKPLYALRTPAGFVPSRLPGWNNATVIVQISPAMGARMCQYEITLMKGGEGLGETGARELLVYILEGKCAALLDGAQHNLGAGVNAAATV